MRRRSRTACRAASSSATLPSQPLLGGGRTDWNLTERTVAPEPIVGTMRTRARRKCRDTEAAAAVFDRPLAGLRHRAVLRPRLERRRSALLLADVPDLALALAARDPD